MRTTLHIVLLVLASVVATACHHPDITSCPEVDCPGGKVCDNQGGCAFPEQLATCEGKASGDACSYADQSGQHISGECTNGVCLPIGCGNGKVTPEEACDDGNNVSGDGCAADCRSQETCGNGIVDAAAGEQCDDGNTGDGDGCQRDCKLPRCGDGVVDIALGEQCDAADANSLAPDAPCRPTCQRPRCGDNVIDRAAGEVCDDGNNQTGDGCSGDCKSDETCGNHVLDVIRGEACDDGNTTSGDGCSADCASLEVCGNCVQDAGEVCDDCNTVSGDGCSADCKSLEVCGNSIIDGATEQCDLGGLNSNAPDAACRTTCKLQRCGDTIVDPMHGEQCDDGLLNADVANACRTSCQNPRCGDNIKDTGEVCDDGNNISGDNCSSDCKSLEVCGNGIVDTARGEQCDAGGANSNNPNATCRSDCQRQRCGDAILDNLLGEVCDLGAANSNAANATCRTNCLPARCGDGVVDNLTGEVCDDGNTTSGDGCSSDCKSLEVCGNSIVDTVNGEQCDAGGANSSSPNATCRTNCLLQRCGDAIVDDLKGELCDLGGFNSNAANATCRLNCQPQRCGDGVTDNTKGEVCDDGNTVSGDGCSADCTSLETCGNNIVDTAKGEQCDAGSLNSDAPNATCRTSCKLPRCGDTITDNLLGELCDAGNANSNAPNAACRTNCLPRRCGDLITDNLSSEVCDDGNNVSGDGCSADCTSSEICGNGIIDTAKNEQCDNGGLNSDAPNATCRTSCQRQKCGDTIVDNAFGEQCDLGGSNSNAPNATCRTSCTSQRCGDGVVDNLKGEVCDDSNNLSGDGCSGDCKSLETCGNGYVDTAKGEQCDAGGANSNAPNAPCRTNCQLPSCGDSVVDTAKGEQCDAGTSNSNLPNATCRTNCLFSRCGDNVTDSVLGEVCDDGNTVSADGCRSDCKSNESCGNGILDTQVGELCDDGNTRAYDGCSACLPETAVVLAPGGTPPPRYAPVLVYDGARQRVVMFGGRTAGNAILADTWEWDGAGWTKLLPAHAPSARYDAGAAYDAKRHRVVVFGGTTLGSGANTRDTWEWDGVDWVQRTPATLPSGRTGAAMTFDANRGHVIMFGGTDGTTANQETWDWDGANWSLLAPAFKPSARAGARAAFDSAHKYVVMFGGTADTHTYTFDGTSWFDMGSTSGPTTGYAANGMAFDAERGAVIVWGGGANTYSWTGAAWSTLVGSVPTTPRTNITMTYDAVRKQIVLFGGLNGASPYSDTWLRTTTWSAAPAFAKPPARLRAKLAYDPIRQRTVLFGGQASTARAFREASPSFLQDTWEWDGRRWLQVAASTPPAVRAEGRLAYDTSARVMRLSGGDAYETTPTVDHIYNDVYTYNGAAWSIVTASGAQARFHGSMAYDASQNKLVAFAGADTNYVDTNTTFVWSAGSWSTLSPPTSPSARRNLAIAYDPIRQRTVLFSGIGGGGFLSDTWELNATAPGTWTKLSPTSSPPPRYGYNMFFDPDIGKVCVFGSSPLTTEDLWQWDGTTWTEISMIGTIDSKYAPATAYDAFTHSFVAFGGRSHDLSNFVPTNNFGLVRYRPNKPVEACFDSQIDYDNDGKFGCADEECWPQCDPLHSPGIARPTGAPFCGDTVCTPGFESCSICPGDCGQCTTTKCGDFHCDSGETPSSCPNDC